MGGFWVVLCLRVRVPWHRRRPRKYGVDASSVARSTSKLVFAVPTAYVTVHRSGDGPGSADLAMWWSPTAQAGYWAHVRVVQAYGDEGASAITDGSQSMRHYFDRCDVRAAAVMLETAAAALAMPLHTRWRPATTKWWIRARIGGCHSVRSPRRPRPCQGAGSCQQHALQLKDRAWLYPGTIPIVDGADIDADAPVHRIDTVLEHAVCRSRARRSSAASSPVPVRLKVPGVVRVVPVQYAAAGALFSSARGCRRGRPTPGRRSRRACLSVQWDDGPNGYDSEQYSHARAPRSAAIRRCATTAMPPGLASASRIEPVLHLPLAHASLEPPTWRDGQSHRQQM